MGSSVIDNRASEICELAGSADWRYLPSARSFLLFAGILEILPVVVVVLVVLVVYVLVRRSSPLKCQHATQPQ